MQRIIILGGNNSLGQIIARHLLAAGLYVSVFAEAENDFKISHHNYNYIRGDVYNIHSVSQAITDQDIVISVYSTSYLWKLYYLRDALQNIISSMKERNKYRFIFLSYTDLDSFFTKKKITHNFLKKIFGNEYESGIKSMNDSNIIKSGLSYTIDSLDTAFLKHIGKEDPSQALKKYYSYIAEEIRNQVLNTKDLNQLVQLNYLS